MTTPTADPQPERLFVCPYCGGPTPAEARCRACAGPLDPLSRQASQNDMGPWFVRDPASPFRPGFSTRTLRHLVARGRIRPDTVVRGPTTRQFWMPARRAPGVSALLFICHNCQAQTFEGDARCVACDADLALPEDRQSLGLGPIVPVPGQAAAWEGGAEPNPDSAVPKDDRIDADLESAAALRRLRRANAALKAWLIVSLAGLALLAGVLVVLLTR